uniref:Uncharacterized protein n=1 Tax=Tetradesmus obliquus TaxID=3088 RepID=A0A383VZR5_TETOB|eukprot:jgi/Sobl393_1/18521/SZX70945.1
MVRYIARLCGPPSEWSNQNETLVRKLASAQLQDLLLIAVNLSDSWQAGCIQHACRENNMLMYAQSSSSSSSSAAAGSSSTAAGSSSTDSSSNSSMVQLVEHLLTTAMIRGHNDLVDGVADAPPAQQLSPQAVAKLLCLRIQLEQPDEESEHDLEDEDAAARAVSGFAALLKLPGVKAMQPAELASLVSLARRRGHLRFVQCVIRAVPAAQQLPSRVLCDALLAAGAAEKRQLVQELAELQAAQQLAPGDAVRLVQQLLCDSWGEGVYEALEDLEPMQLGSQLTGGELLQLLREAIHSDDGSAVSDIAGLTPASHQIDDIEGYTAFLQEALCNSVDCDVLRSAVRDLPATQQLPVDAVLDFCLRGIKGDLRLLDRFFELPAVSKFSTAAIEQLLLAMLQQKQRSGWLSTMAVLLRAPAAGQISVETAAAVLKYAVQEQPPPHDTEPLEHFVFHGEMQQQLLALPAMQQLPADAVASVLTTAVEAGMRE